MLKWVLSASIVAACLNVSWAGDGPAKPAPSKADDPSVIPSPSLEPRLPVAGLTTVYHYNSHADMFLSRMLQTYTLDKKGQWPSIYLKSLYMDQPQGLEKRPDIGAAMAREAGVPVVGSIPEALTLNTDKLAVKAVHLIAEHGNYDKNEFGSTRYPKRRFFDETVKVFRQTGQVVPVFVDKHLADNWDDAKHIYDTAREMNIPLMAGSSLPITWRKPAADVKRAAKLREIVVLSYHTLDHYGFHAMEILQCLAERRAGGETGIKAVQTLSDGAVWDFIETEKLDIDVYYAAWDRLPRKLNGKRALRDAVKNPTLFIVEYADGLKGYVFTLNGAVGEWSAAWRYEDGGLESSWFMTQEARPFMHFSWLTKDIEKMYATGKPTWPVERTLMTSGALDYLLRSKAAAGQRIVTPQLEAVKYQSTWDWVEPPPPPVQVK